MTESENVCFFFFLLPRSTLKCTRTGRVEELRGGAAAEAKLPVTSLHPGVAASQWKTLPFTIRVVSRRGS